MTGAAFCSSSRPIPAAAPRAAPRGAQEEARGPTSVFFGPHPRPLPHSGSTAGRGSFHVTRLTAGGNRLSQTTAGSAGSVVTPGVTAYGYDTRDRLLTENGTSYGYDANGNLTTQSGFGTYTFDTENRLVRIAKFDGTVIEHAYDADGARIRTKTTPPASPTQTTNFLVDTSGGLSHVVAEFGASGVQTAYYLRALDDLLAVIRPTGTRYYHADGIGSIRKLTDETGAVTDSYEYTAFGEQYEHVGTDPQPYSFAGEPLDPNAGFQYHRARWMQPSTGRFAGMDPWTGSPCEPSALHRYTYANNEPPSTSDPTGQFSLGVSITIGAMLGALASISLPNLSATQRVGLVVLGAALGALGGALYAGSAVSSLIVTANGASVWFLPPVIRGRLIE